MDFDAIKSNPLGRAWLVAFVRRVWEHMLTERDRQRVLEAERLARSTMIIRMSAPDQKSALDHRLRDMGIIGALRWEGWRKLTPLGVEVYLYGRRQARKGARRP